MLKTEINVEKLLLFFILLMSIFPVINLLGFEIPPLYFITPIGLIFIFFIMIGKIAIPKVLKFIILFFILIVLEIFISTFISSITILNTVVLPTDAMQYIARLGCISIFILWLYYSKIEIKTVIKSLLIIFNLAMLIGILQWISWPGQTFFINLYSFRDGIEQLSQIDRALHLRRAHGVAQHATANGGVAAFVLIFASSIYIYYKKYKFLSLSLIILAILNIFASQSRAGVIALVFSFFLFYIVDIFIKRKGFITTLKFVSIILLLLSAIYVAYLNGNAVITRQVYRWNDLFETGGGARIDQIHFALNLQSNLKDYIFGISRVVQNYGDLKFFIEIEPINIFVLYGVLGFVIQYSLVAYLLVYFLKSIRLATKPEVISLLVASFVSLFSYQVFSLGYFFFREIRIGLLPWILMGISIGIYERENRKLLKKK